jgi:hypothetical protein
MLFTDVSMAAETPKQSLEPRDVHRGVVPCRLNETGDPHGRGRQSESGG